MQNFTTKIVRMMKDENLFAWQGGPIIMAQVNLYKWDIFLSLTSMLEELAIEAHSL